MPNQPGVTIAEVLVLDVRLGHEIVHHVLQSPNQRDELRTTNAQGSNITYSVGNEFLIGDLQLFEKFFAFRETINHIFGSMQNEDLLQCICISETYLLAKRMILEGSRRTDIF